MLRELFKFALLSLLFIIFPPIPAGPPRPKAHSRGELSVYYYADSRKNSTEVGAGGEEMKKEGSGSDIEK